MSIENIIADLGKAYREAIRGKSSDEMKILDHDIVTDVFTHLAAGRIKEQCEQYKSDEILSMDWRDAAQRIKDHYPNNVIEFELLEDMFGELVIVDGIKTRVKVNFMSNFWGIDVQAETYRVVIEAIDQHLDNVRPLNPVCPNCNDEMKYGAAEYVCMNQLCSGHVQKVE